MTEEWPTTDRAVKITPFWYPVSPDQAKWLRRPNFVDPAWIEQVWASSLYFSNRVLHHISSFLSPAICFIVVCATLEGSGARQRSDSVRHILRQFSKAFFSSTVFFPLKVPAIAISFAPSFLFVKFFLSSKSGCHWPSISQDDSGWLKMTFL